MLMKIPHSTVPSQNLDFLIRTSCFGKAGCDKVVKACSSRTDVTGTKLFDFDLQCTSIYGLLAVISLYVGELKDCCRA